MKGLSSRSEEGKKVKDDENLEARSQRSYIYIYQTQLMEHTWPVSWVGTGWRMKDKSMFLEEGKGVYIYAFAAASRKCECRSCRVKCAITSCNGEAVLGKGFLSLVGEARTLIATLRCEAKFS